MRSILKKAAAAILSAAVALSSAAYAEQAVYDKATNTVTVDASGYSTVSIVPENADVSDKDNIIYINQTAMDFGAQASFVLQDNPADGDYIISLGNGADTSEVKKIKFTVGGSEEEYPFYASFKKNDDNSLTASAEFTSAVSGTMLFVLYGKDGTLTDVNVQNVTETGIKEHTFKNCESGQKIKLMLWKNIDNMETVSKPYEIPTDDITAAPDFLRVTENGELAKNDGEAPLDLLHSYKSEVRFALHCSALANKKSLKLRPDTAKALHAPEQTFHSRAANTAYWRVHSRPNQQSCCPNWPDPAKPKPLRLQRDNKPAQAHCRNDDEA